MLTDAVAAVALTGDRRDDRQSTTSRQTRRNPMTTKPKSTSGGSSSSKPPSPGRFAHPFFEPPAPPPAPSSHITQWSKAQLGPVPPVTGNGSIALDTIIGAPGVQEIERLGEIRFHALGDSGVGHADEAEKVAEEMATDFKPGAGALNPAFLLHLGDVIYGPDKENHYGERFYRPYRHYPGKIIAIPGNHDGEVKSPADSPALKAFRANFCAAAAVVPPQASGSGIFRETMTQPGVYWLLDAPFVRVIGLYSNSLENPGYLEGDGGNDKSQLDWLQKTLKRIAGMDKKALVIGTHHPPFSQSGHSGSTEMSQSIDAACAAAGVVPDAFLAAHAHNYQRYTRRMGGKQVPYIVAGGGGMPPQKVVDATGQPADAGNQTTYDAAMESLGYLFVTASAQLLKFEFWPLGAQHTQPFDPFTLDLGSHVLTRG
jgi:Calcineurin-like phosphoesterase